MTDPISRLAEALTGRYRIERELGAGGMATVYLAEDLRHHRQVALKVLKPELTAALGADRFAREIEIAASLHHPHILPLFDSGEAVISRESRPTTLLYYVMPFVEGESLRARLARERQLPVEDALRITADIADALAYAHQRGLIHRDVKPENILLEGGHGMLMDFGIARALSSNEAQRLTDSGLVVGTPIYMSPEQASGERKLDGRSDQYALACVLYEMLAGQPPFIGATVEALVRQHVMAPVPPVTQFRPMVSPGVTEALTRALAKSPADRFATASDFSAALTSSIPTNTASKISGAPAARRPNRILLAVAGGLLVLLAVAAWLVIRRDKAPAAGVRGAGYSIAVLPFESIGNDSSDAAFVAGVHGDIITQLGKIPAFQVASRTAVRNYQAGTRPDRDIAADLGVSVLLTGSVQRSGGQVHVTVALEDAEHDRQLWADSYDRPLTAENVFAIQGDIARQVANALRVQLSPGEDSAVSAVATTNLAALELYYRAIASRDSIGIYGPDTLTAALAAQAVAIDPKFAQAWALLTEARSWLLHQGITFDTLPAHHAFERTGALAPGSLEARLAAGYYLYFVRADYPGALAQFEAGAALSPRSGSILIAIGLVQRRMGRWDDALATFQRAKSANPHDASVAAVLAETYGLMRRYEEGDSEFARALALAPLGSVSFQRFQLLLDGVGDSARARDVASAAVQEMSPETAARLRAALAQVRRDYPTAIAQLESVPRSAFLEAVPPRDLSLALLWRYAGDRARSRALADSTVAEADSALARWPSAEARSSAGIRAIIEGYRAVALALAGDSAAAVRQAAQAQRDLPPTQDHLTGIVLQRWIAVAYVYAGQPAEAIATVRRLMSEPATLGLGELRLDPIWDPIRHNPEFQALTAQ